MSETEKNLMEAFAGESKANRKYLAFAKKAEEEGFHGIAKLFRVAASGETIHAFNHLEALNFVKSTKENLKSSIEGESYEFEEMYPNFINKAKEEGNEKAAQSFEWAMKVEKIHNNLFKEALEKLEKGEDYNDVKYFYVCKKCGYPSKGIVPQKCPICGAEDFMAIE
ncbi:MAG: rubrerythrin family protein [Nanoarchaeota archaeon]|nr:rubrerythrin family protein [Nanoarchaeota archaeon]